jgi:hypothetical protein
MVKVNPKIVLDFTQEIKLEINLVHDKPSTMSHKEWLIKVVAKACSLRRLLMLLLVTNL